MTENPLMRRRTPAAFLFASLLALAACDPAPAPEGEAPDSETLGRAEPGLPEEQEAFWA